MLFGVLCYVLCLIRISNSQDNMINACYHRNRGMRIDLKEGSLLIINMNTDSTHFLNCYCRIFSVIPDEYFTRKLNIILPENFEPFRKQCLVDCRYLTYNACVYNSTDCYTDIRVQGSNSEILELNDEQIWENLEWESFQLRWIKYPLEEPPESLARIRISYQGTDSVYVKCGDYDYVNTKPSLLHTTTVSSRTRSGSEAPPLTTHAEQGRSDTDKQTQSQEKSRNTVIIGVAVGVVVLVSLVVAAAITFACIKCRKQSNSSRIAGEAAEMEMHSIHSIMSSVQPGLQHETSLSDVGPINHAVNKEFKLNVNNQHTYLNSESTLPSIDDQKESTIMQDNDVYDFRSMGSMVMVKENNGKETSQNNLLVDETNFVDNCAYESS